MPISPSGTARLAAVAFSVLLAATIGAFLVANRLKSKPPVIEVIRRDTFFSPNGDGRRDKDTIVYTVDFDDRASVDVVDADGVVVRRITDRERLRANRPGRVTWDGRDDDGRVVPDGEYRLRFILDEGRSLLAPRPFYVDTEPPRPAVVVDDDTPIIRPGGRVAFRVRGAGLDEAPSFTVLRTDVSPPRAVRKLAGEVGTTSYEWDGRNAARRPRRARDLPDRRHRLRQGAQPGPGPAPAAARPAARGRGAAGRHRPLAGGPAAGARRAGGRPRQPARRRPRPRVQLDAAPTRRAQAGPVRPPRPGQDAADRPRPARAVGHLPAARRVARVRRDRPDRRARPQPGRAARRPADGLVARPRPDRPDRRRRPGRVRLRLGRRLPAPVRLRRRHAAGAAERDRAAADLHGRGGPALRPGHGPRPRLHRGAGRRAARRADGGRADLDQPRAGQAAARLRPRRRPPGAVRAAGAARLRVGRRQRPGARVAGHPRRRARRPARRRPPLRRHAHRARRGPGPRAAGGLLRPPGRLRRGRGAARPRAAGRR